MGYPGKVIPAEVLEKAKKGETKAFDYVADRVLNSMKPIVDPSGRENEEDIKSLKRIALWEALQKFDPKKIELEHSSFTGYARQLVKWRVLDSFPERRRKGNIKLVPLTPIQNDDGTEVTMEDLLESKENIDEETFIAATKLKKWVSASRSDTMERIYNHYSKHGIVPHSELARQLNLNKWAIASALREMQRFLAKGR